MRSHASSVVLSSVLAFALAGCGFVSAPVALRDAAGSFATAADVAHLLTAAGEGAGPDEIDTAAVEPARPSGGGVGLLAHAGVFMAAGADTVSFDPNVMFGAAYELPFLKSESLAVEIGLDFTSVSNDDKQLSSTMLLISASARFALGALYVTGSGCLLNENYTDDASGDNGTNTGMLIGLGVGYSPLEGKWDVRGAYHVIPGSENLGGIVTVSGGYAF